MTSVSKFLKTEEEIWWGCVEGRGSGWLGWLGGCNLYAKGPVHKLLHLFKAFSVIMICEYYNYFDFFVKMVHLAVDWNLNYNEFSLATMGVLAHGIVHARPSTQSENLALTISANPPEVLNKL